MAIASKKNKASYDGSYHLINFPRNWLHQALTYMDRGELTFRILLESLAIIILYFVITQFFVNISPYGAIALAFIISHTTNWIVNGNFWALYLFAVPAACNQGKHATEKYLTDMGERLRKAESIGGLAVFGSAARGGWHAKSDLDIRVVRRRGFLNLLCSNFLVMRERLIALKEKQPADLFLADGVRFLRKMRVDERPIFLIKRMASLEEEYPANAEIEKVNLDRG